MCLELFLGRLFAGTNLAFGKQGVHVYSARTVRLSLLCALLVQLVCPETLVERLLFGLAAHRLLVLAVIVGRRALIALGCDMRGTLVRNDRKLFLSLRLHLSTGCLFALLFGDLLGTPLACTPFPSLLFLGHELSQARWRPCFCSLCSIRRNVTVDLGLRMLVRHVLVGNL